MTRPLCGAVLPAEPLLRLRRGRAKQLARQLRKQCLAACQELLAAQREWRQELAASIPGLAAAPVYRIDVRAPAQSPKSKPASIVRAAPAAHRPRPVARAPSARPRDGLAARTEATAAAMPAAAVMPQGAAPRTPPASSHDRKPKTTPEKRPQAKPAALLRRRGQWRGYERESLRRALMLHGLGQAEKVRGSIKSDVERLRHGLGDVIDASWELVRQCGEAAPPRERAWAEGVYAAATAACGGSGSSVEAGPAVTERVGLWKAEVVTKQAQAWCRRLRLLQDLDAALHFCREPETAVAAMRIVEGLRDATVPAPWWTAAADLALLSGSARHGFGIYEAMRADVQCAAAFGPPSTAPEKAAGSGLLSEAAQMSLDMGTTGEGMLSEGSPLTGGASLEVGQLQPGDEAAVVPDSNTLTRRMKRLVDTLTRARQQLEALAGRKKERAEKQRRLAVAKHRGPWPPASPTTTAEGPRRPPTTWVSPNRTLPKRAFKKAIKLEPPADGEPEESSGIGLPKNRKVNALHSVGGPWPLNGGRSQSPVMTRVDGETDQWDAADTCLTASSSFGGDTREVHGRGLASSVSATERDFDLNATSTGDVDDVDVGKYASLIT
eukprot:SM000044S16022  [mRNA]  locus=s44:627479:630047:+ [translate_table: standard]